MIILKMMNIGESILDKKSEDNIWIDEYKKYFSNNGKCLDLGCGIGKYSQKFIEYGYDVTSSDISEIALSRVKEFNGNVKKVDMREELPFQNNEFEVVFANLSIHYFSDVDTQKLMQEIKRILKQGGIFIGSVNAIQGFNVIKDTSKEIEYHYWFNKGKYVRLFDEQDLRKYLNIFEIIELEERETIRFKHKKNYFIFICKK